MDKRFVLVALMFTGSGWAATQRLCLAMSSAVPAMHQKRVLITGASGSLGRKMVDKFLCEGFQVIGIRSPFQKASDSSTEYSNADKKSNLLWKQVDLSSSAKVCELSKDIGGVDVLVHCAGGFRFAKTEDILDSDLEYLLNTNLKSAFYLAREFLPSMKEKNYGRIVFISAKATLQPGAGVGAYAASKAGLNALTSSLATEVLDYDITVNALLPTIIDSPANRDGMAQANFTKWVRPEQLADIAFSLVSPWGNPINGALIPVSGRL